LRKLIIGIVALIVLAVGAVLIVPGFLDWNRYKPDIAAAVEQQTGRKLAIDGDIDLRILPSPRLSVAGVRLANLAGAADPDMVSLQALEVHIALAPLFSGRVQVTSFTLVKPRVSLEILAGGKANWDLAPAGAAPAGSTPATGGSSGGGSPVAVQLDGADIVDGAVIYRDAAAGSEQRVEKLNAAIKASSLNGPVKAKGSLVFAGKPIAFDAGLGEIDAGKAASLDATVTLGEALASVRYEGTIDLDGGPALRGKLTINAAKLSAALQALAGPNPAMAANPLLGRALEVAVQVEGTPEKATLDRLALKLGDIEVQGAASATLTTPIRLDAKLTSSRLNLDALAGGAASPATTPGAAPAPGATAPAAEAFALPADVTADLQLNVDAIEFRGGTIRQARMEAGLKDGKVTIRSLRAQLPGGSDVTVSGEVAAQAGAPRFTGRADVVSDNLRAALDWLGADTQGIAPDRLRKAAIGTEVEATPEQIKLSSWTMELDTTKASGGLTLLLRDRPAFGLSLSVDKINVDAYMPAPASGQAQGGQPAAAAQPAKPAASPIAGVVESLSRFDANVVLRIGEATVQKTQLRDAKLDATVQNGGITVRQLSVADLGGVSLSLDGTVAGLAAGPNTDLSFKAETRSLARATRLAGIEPTPLMQRIGAVKLDGKLLGTLQSMTVKLNVDTLGGAVAVNGVVQPLAAPFGFDLAAKVTHPSAAGLITALAPDAMPPKTDLGALTLAATLTTRGSDRIAVDSTIDIAAGRLLLKGEVQPYLAAPGLDLAVDFQHPDVVRLIRIAEPEFKPAKRDLGGAALVTAIKGTTAALNLAGLKLVAGPVTLNGQGSVETGGARPKLALSLAGGRIDVDPWLPQDAPRPTGGVAPVVPAKSASREWSRDRIDTSGLTAADATTELKLESVVYGAYVLDKVDVRAVLANGVLTLERFNSGMFGGTVAMTGKLAHGDVPAADMTLAVKNADVRKAAMAAAGSGQVTGVLDYDTSLSTRGQSEFALISALQGKGAMTVRDGSVEGIDLPAISQQLDKLDRATDFLTLAQRSMNGGSTPFRSLKGTYVVEKGVLRSNDIELDAAAASGKATAVINLPPQEMDVNTRFWLSEHQNSPPVGVRLVGPLDNPRRVLDIEKLQAYVLQRMVQRGVLRQFDKNNTLAPLLGGGATQQPAAQPAQPGTAEPAPAPAPEVKPEDALNGLLKGLLKK
jgi:uncharacterized protein involved in outer membrane biogenesis